jgi:hypothetical protein
MFIGSLPNKNKTNQTKTKHKRQRARFPFSIYLEQELTCKKITPSVFFEKHYGKAITFVLYKLSLFVRNGNCTSVLVCVLCAVKKSHKGWLN